MNKGGGRLLANLTYKTNDIQTLRMITGAIANLCGNEKLHIMLKKDGVTRALLELSKIDDADDVITQIARGIANFAKCETRNRYNGKRKGKSLLIDDNVLNWILYHSKRAHGSTRRNIDLALCHLAQNEHNTADIVSSGALEELHRMSEESLENDIRDFAKKTLNLNPAFVKSSQIANV
ncbi:hypothetical protein ZOSMA_7G00480 [Zostera marina]|uniref:Uncharacterized protein n=1 Tax=Zostera marina TaxID=29655 RepID=A0A0K9NML1_ZOSMR|nr:hypothetical protein ZOSMA_7G00480 [Zostera marina]